LLSSETKARREKTQLNQQPNPQIPSVLNLKSEITNLKSGSNPCACGKPSPTVVPRPPLLGNTIGSATPLTAPTGGSTFVIP
jgi:hypothetical protein